MTGPRGGRGLAAMVIALLLLLALVDLLRPGSTLRGIWRDVRHEGTPMERAVDEFQRTRGESVRQGRDAAPRPDPTRR